MTDDAERLAAWQRILEPHLAPLRAAVAAAGQPDPGLLRRLRDEFPRALVEVALDLIAGRRKAAGKFAEPERLLCDPQGVEQASAADVAEHKARRFAAAPAIVDLCCGIGGDTMALAAAGARVVAVDRSAVRCLMAAHNAGVPSVAADVADYPLDPAAWIHVDPSRRRTGSIRLWRYADYRPGPAVLEPVLAAAAGAAVKLGPGIEWRELPARRERELEFIGDGRGLSQAVLWCGALCRAPGAHTATRLDRAGQPISFTAIPADGEVAVAATPGRFLFVPDPALERGDLLGPRLAGRDVAELAPGLGVLSGDRRLGDPWFEEHEILAVLPWRDARIRAWLAAHDGGPVVVRTRDGAVATDAAQVRLRGKGDTSHVLFGLRLGRRVVCVVTG